MTPIIREGGDEFPSYETFHVHLDFLSEIHTINSVILSTIDSMPRRIKSVAKARGF